MDQKGDDEGIPPPPPSGAHRRLLSRRMVWISTAISILVFVIWEGAKWRRADAVDAAAWWSYAVIPPLIVAALIYEHKLRFLPWLLGVVEVTAWKFIATYCYAQTMWMIAPPITPVTVPPVVFEEVREPPRKTVVDSGETGIVEGRLTAGGVPIFGAIVFVDAGLERYAFSPPATAIHITSGSDVITADAEVAEVGQQVEARSSDGRLHTLIASTSEGDAFSIPLQSSGAWSAAKLRPLAGVAKLHCGVHQRSNESGRLVIATNPFWTKTDRDGAFRLTGIPAARVHVSALGKEGTSTAAEAIVSAGGVSELALSW
jgi:hypothetical protein